MPIIEWSKTHRAADGVMVSFIGWLRRDRWFADEYEATVSRFIYSKHEDREAPFRFGTSILGVINGVLPRLGIVLVVYVNEGTPVPPYLGIRRRWWP